MKQIIFIFYLIIFNINFVYSKEINNYYKVKYIDNYDGDTICFEIFSSKNRNEEISIKKTIRLKNINTPEIKSKNKIEKKLAIKSKEKSKELLLKANKIDLLNCTVEKFGRMLCDVNIDGKDLKKMIE